MNKRTITVDQLIREEYLKLQKENYLKNIILQEAKKWNKRHNIKEQNILAKKAGILQIRNVVDIMSQGINDAGTQAKYAPRATFKPYNFSKTPMAGVPTQFSSNVTGIDLKNIKFNYSIAYTIT